MEDQMFPRRFTDALRPGAYLRIIVEGNVGAGDEIRVTFKPLNDLTIRGFLFVSTPATELELERLSWYLRDIRRLERMGGKLAPEDQRQSRTRSRSYMLLGA